jgi:riboflavin synthase alpha subunit
MFTGIIEELGSVRSIEERGENARLVISAHVVTEGTNHGDSISVNGVCLTALDIEPDSFAADISRETLQRSTLGSLQPGAPVNLERSVTPATRLGGHTSSRVTSMLADSSPVSKITASRGPSESLIQKRSRVTWFLRVPSLLKELV